MSKALENLQKAQERAMAIRPKIGGFPYLAEVLRRAGVTRNIWSLPSCQSLFLTEDGPVMTQGTALVSGTVDVPTFNRDIRGQKIVHCRTLHSLVLAAEGHGLRPSKRGGLRRPANDKRPMTNDCSYVPSLQPAKYSSCSGVRRSILMPIDSSFSFATRLSSSSGTL